LPPPSPITAAPLTELPLCDGIFCLCIASFFDLVAFLRKNKQARKWLTKKRIRTLKNRPRRSRQNQQLRRLLSPAQQRQNLPFLLLQSRQRPRRPNRPAQLRRRPLRKLRPHRRSPRGPCRNRGRIRSWMR